MNSREIELIGTIQPQGGISFADPRFIKKGDGYEACIHVYRYPKEVHTSWLTVLTSIQDAIVTIETERYFRLESTVLNGCVSLWITVLQNTGLL